jgi:hypothetical protein
MADQVECKREQFCVTTRFTAPGLSSGTEKLNQQTLRRVSKLRRSLSVRTRKEAK